MKWFFLYSLFTIFAAGIILSSCGKEAEAPAPAPLGPDAFVVDEFPGILVEGKMKPSSKVSTQMSRAVIRAYLKD